MDAQIGKLLLGRESAEQRAGDDLDQSGLRADPHPRQQRGVVAQPGVQLDCHSPVGADPNRFFGLFVPAGNVIVAAGGMNRAMTYVAQHRAGIDQPVGRNEYVDIPRHFAKRITIGQRADYQPLEEQQGNIARGKRVAQLAAQQGGAKAMVGD
jgi:hypothetical protein